MNDIETFHKASIVMTIQPTRFDVLVRSNSNNDTARYRIQKNKNVDLWTVMRINTNNFKEALVLNSQGVFVKATARQMRYAKMFTTSEEARLYIGGLYDEC